ncbi:MULTISPECIES: dynamin family protein [unclassified Exiguobacterium]|uniref:dynamin family protein n=1 Tax=unclassified Exiguobacterium TaxID=2644629 RepID=UPI001BE6D640|nr:MULTISPECIES: dynamin family protein [unclassified Exiguobacterium]
MYLDTVEKIKRVKDVIAQEEIFIVVVGEFNHGKSTFVNSLLRQDLLPTGILPTTATINIIGQGDEKIQIHKQEQIVTVKSEDLRSYIGDSDVSEIEWIGIRHPNIPFAPPVYVVDTPGLNDVNKKRSDVSYKFIPKADIVFFLLKAEQPITETELSFLRDTLLKEGLHRIIFVMNFADAFEDEEEELEEMIESLKETLCTIEGLDDPIIIPFDAKRALNNSILGQTSEVDELISQIEKFQKNGLESLRLPRYKAMFNEVTRTFNQEQETYNQLDVMKVEELEIIRTWIDSANEANQVHFSEIKNYLEVRQNDLLLMIDKSIERLSEEWIRECNRVVKRYQGPSAQFLEVIQQDIEHILSTERKRWVERYTPQVDLYIRKVQQEVLQSVTNMTKQQAVVLWKQIEQDNLSEVLFQPPFSDGKPDPTITAGLVAGGAAAIMLGLGGGLLLPFVGLAAYPIIRKKLETQALTEAKNLMLMDLDKIVHVVLKDMKQTLETYVEKSFATISETTLSQIANHYRSQEEKIQKQLHNQKNDKNVWYEQKNTIEKELEHEIEKIKEALFK